MHEHHPDALGAIPVLADVRAAAARIAPHVLRTPVLPGRGGLDAMTGARLYFKCENLQRCGAFKFRGAMNAVLMLGPEARMRGVATHSSGNHGAALALAASRCDARAWVVMPANAARVKVEAVRAYGGEIRFCEPTQTAREQALAELVAATGAAYVPPYDDWHIVAGQGTAALELLTDVPELDVVMAPVGGGGLTSGTAIAAKGMKPGIRVVAAEPANADDAYRSLQAGRVLPSSMPQTIADGLRTSLSERTFAAIRAHVDEIITVEESSIVHAMRLLWERLKVVVEPSSAVPMAALLARRLDFEGANVGIILSGGNVDLDVLPWSEPT
jgi:threonine dehydratase